MKEGLPPPSKTPSMPDDHDDLHLIAISDYYIIEIFLLCTIMALWLMSLHKLYAVWDSTLNFSEASLQRSSGGAYFYWDTLLQWVMSVVKVKLEKCSCIQ